MRPGGLEFTTPEGFVRGKVLGRAQHKQYGTPAYISWTSMMSRCYNSTNHNYARYGARGITVCSEWHDFRVFFSDMGERPVGKTLDRINGDAIYKKDNCRWATRMEQRQNMSDAVLITYEGKTLCLDEWARQKDMHRATLRSRIAMGWKPDKLFSPVRKKRKAERKKK